MWVQPGAGQIQPPLHLAAWAVRVTLLSFWTKLESGVLSPATRGPHFAEVR